MRCEENDERWFDYLSGELSEQERRELETHLASCRSCREELDSLRETWELLGRLPGGVSPAEARTRFQRMLTAYERGQARVPVARGRGPRLIRIAAQLAASVALLLLGGMAGYGMKSAESPPGSEEGLTRFLLVVYEVADRLEEIPTERMREAGERYRAWENELTRKGKLLDVARLKLEGAASLSRRAGEPDVSPLHLATDREAITYYWLILARDHEEAVEIANGCPMLDLGSRIELRELETWERA